MLKHKEKTHKNSTNIKILTKLVRFEQFPELDRTSHSADEYNLFIYYYARRQHITCTDRQKTPETKK